MKHASDLGARLVGVLLCAAAGVHGGHATEIYLVQEVDAGPTRYQMRILADAPQAVKVAVADGGRHLLILTRNGEVWAWGDNRFGQLGTGDDQLRDGWSRVQGLGKAVAIAAGARHSAAVLEDGSLWTWGDNSEGQLGDGTLLARFRPAPVPGLKDIVSVAAGARGTAVLRSDGAAWAWGQGSSGQLGDSTTRMD